MNSNMNYKKLLHNMKIIAKQKKNINNMFFNNKLLHKF